MLTNNDKILLQTESPLLENLTKHDKKIALKHVVNLCRQGLLTKLFHNIPNPKVARFLGFIQGFHGQIVDANAVLGVF